MTSDMLRKSTQVFATGICLGLIAWAYWPGLGGPFLFDDYANLNDLGAYGPMDDWRSFLYYLTSGTADPTGRPVALLSFLIDAQDWPADPWPFKRTNLVLHLLNTALVLLVLSRLQSALRRRHPDFRVSQWTPLLAATLWGAHPLLVSTTLYVVQREAMLAATFVLLAILAWINATDSSRSGRTLAAWGWASFGVGGLTILAGLSKANGFLAPLLAGLVYLWFLRNPAASRTTDRMAVIVLGLPSLAIIVYLLDYAWSLWSVPYLYGRDWTLPERLLSQPRAIWSYVFQLTLPRAGGGGLYVDDFTSSRGWLSPATTLPATLGLLTSIVAAVALRRRYPIASFAWLFFLAGHLLESSVVALELYFEHRNYLPAAVLGWPVAHFLLRPGAYERYRIVFATMLAAALLLLTYQRASVWADENTLAAVTAAHRTGSIRSQVEEGRLLLQQGRAAEAVEQVRAMQRQQPDSVIAAINMVSIECLATGRLAAESLSRSKEALRVATSWNYGLYTWFANAATSPQMRDCDGFGLTGLNQLVDAGLANPRNSGNRRRRDFLHAKGRISLAADDARSALARFNEALQLEPDPAYALVQAAALGNAGFQQAGVAHLDNYLRMESSLAPRIRDMRTLHRWLLVETGYYRREIDTLRNRMIADQQELH